VNEKLKNWDIGNANKGAILQLKTSYRLSFQSCFWENFKFVDLTKKKKEI
jgi:hypothetical protein